MLQKILSLSAIALVLACQPKPTEIHISSQAIAPVDDNIFGHFLEKASWDNETGGDVLIDTATGEYVPGALDYLRAMDIPVIRFPGGTDTDFYPWYFLIDNVPAMGGKRSPYLAFSRDKAVVSDNRMGLTEFFRLCDTLGAEPLLVVNAGDAFTGRRSLAEVAADAAAFVSYCNAPAGNENRSKGQPSWSAIRAQNGHPQPYKVKYWEVGNEPWLWQGLSMATTADSLVERYLTVVEAVIEAMRAVDSSIVIITDGGIKGVNPLLKKRLGNRNDMVAFHPYKPWAISAVVRGADTIDAGLLTDEEVWNAWVAMPLMDTVSGVSSFASDGYYREALSTGYPIAVTEWNWNGWWQLPEGTKKPYDTKFAKGVGAAGFVHAMMRASDVVRMGNQSMLVGKGWGITGIRVDDEGVRHFPTAKVTGLYARYHGNNLLKTDVHNNTFYQQPYTMQALPASPKVALLDVLATGSDSAVYVHIINRSFASDMVVHLTVDSLNLTGEAVVHSFVQSDDDLGRIVDTPVDLTKSRHRVTLPAQSVNIIEVKIK